MTASDDAERTPSQELLAAINEWRDNGAMVVDEHGTIIAVVPPPTDDPSRGDRP